MGEESAKLRQRLAVIENENFSLKRQMQLLQVQSRSSLDELTLQRDRAQKALVHLRNHLEQFQRELCRYEQDAERVQHLEDQQRPAWDAARRRFDVKVPLAEQLLKGVLNEVATPNPFHTRTSSDDSVRSEMQLNHHTKSNCDVVASHGRDNEGCTVQIPNHVDGRCRSLAKETALEKASRLTSDNTTEQVKRDFAETLQGNKTRQLCAHLRWLVKLQKLADLSLDSDNQDGEMLMLQDVAKPSGVTPLVTEGSSATHKTFLQPFESAWLLSRSESPNSLFPKQHQNNNEQFPRGHEVKKVENRDVSCLFTAYDDSSDDEFRPPLRVMHDLRH